MGGIESKFHDLLLQGKAEEALETWVQSEYLQTKVDINSIVRKSKAKDPLLHCLLRNGDYHQIQVKVMAEEMLSKGADPLQQNEQKETALHVVCCSQRHSARLSKMRKEVLELLLDKLDTKPEKNGCEFARRGLEIPDESYNTALHLAAASGLLDCVELLLANGASLYCTNIAKQSPVDIAVQSKQMVIAQLLEAKLIVMGSAESLEEQSSGEFRFKSKSFYDTDELKKMQSEIVQDLAETLRIPEYAGRALLSAYGWSKELARQAFQGNQKQACEKAGLDLDRLQAENKARLDSISEQQCEICMEHISAYERIDIPCDHLFCQECWVRYMEVAISEGGGREIICPGHQCTTPVPMKTVAKLLSDELFTKYSDLSIQNFVDKNRDIKWCPFPDCGQAIMLKETSVDKAIFGEKQGINVECGRGHGFCWNCLKHAHEPCECEVWDRWLQDIVCMSQDKDLTEVADKAEADARWIIDNTKPCPRCEAPIQKNEGCNQMTCRRCLHDFCWVCLSDWELHSHRTGGYFSCNRYMAQRKASSRVMQTRKSLADEYRSGATELHQMHRKKFEHYFERYRNHLLSIQIECNILRDCRVKAKSLVSLRHVMDKKVAKMRGEESITPAKPLDAPNFLEDVVRALLKARRLLATSYGIGYLIPETRKETREAHETLQGKLEEVLEMLAQMVNRPCLNTPRAELQETARNVEYVCQEFRQCMREVVVEGLKPEPPPQPRPRPQPEEVVIEIENPLILFAHLAVQHDPEFRQFWEQFILHEARQQRN